MANPFKIAIVQQKSDSDNQKLNTDNGIEYIKRLVELINIKWR